MGETQAEEEGSTTWCDTDSCASHEKCYCAPRPGQVQKCATKSATSKKNADKLGLDYELFTVGGGGRPVNASEALSVKKTVEVAAVFADVKLSQTTDITDMKNEQQQQAKQDAAAKKHAAKSDHHGHNHHHTHNGSSNHHRRHAGDEKHLKKPVHKLLNKKALAEPTINEYHYIQSSQADVATRKQLGEKKSSRRSSKPESYYQALAPRATSGGSSMGLEDSLGYLP